MEEAEIRALIKGILVAIVLVIWIRATIKFVKANKDGNPN